MQLETTVTVAGLAVALADTLEANEETTLGSTDARLTASALRRHSAYLADLAKQLDEAGSLTFGPTDAHTAAKALRFFAEKPNA